MPPLNALKAFEAAGRHESFAKAAEELGVTAAAVSHQVKALEQWLGGALFIRHAQGLSLTETGRRVLPSLVGAFDGMGDAVQLMRGLTPQRQLSIAALPSVAQLWLGPRLPQLRKVFPNLRPSIHALEAPPNFRREPFDLAIFYRDAPSPQPGETTVCDDIIFPVCAPALATELGTPADLGRVQLLFDTSWTRDWPTWLSAAGAPATRTEGALGFSLFSLALQAAIDGAGVLVAHEPLVAEALASGSIVAPFTTKARTGARLTILQPPGAPADAVAVAEWLSRTSKM
jgi:LysR family glycine cleavage system transcriptional activator